MEASSHGEQRKELGSHFMNPPQFASIICWQHDPVVSVRIRGQKEINDRDPSEGPLDMSAQGSDRRRSARQEGVAKNESPGFWGSNRPRRLIPD